MKQRHNNQKQVAAEKRRMERRSKCEGAVRVGLCLRVREGGRELAGAANRQQSTGNFGHGAQLHGRNTTYDNDGL